MNTWFPIMLSGYGSGIKEKYALITGPIYTNVP